MVLCSLGMTSPFQGPKEGKRKRTAGATHLTSQRKHLLNKSGSFAQPGVVCEHGVQRGLRGAASAATCGWYAVVLPCFALIPPWPLNTCLPSIIDLVPPGIG